MKPLNSDEIKLCQLQAKLFEDSIEKTNYSSAIFIRRFMLSEIVKSFDDKTFLLQTISNDKVFDTLITEYKDTNYGSKKFSKDQLFWIGYIYRCI